VDSTFSIVPYLPIVFGALDLSLSALFLPKHPFASLILAETFPEQFKVRQQDQFQ